MPVLKMSEDKSLVFTKRGNTYQDENNAETLKIILPKAVNGNNLRDCIVYLGFINQQGLGNTKDITEYVKDYSENYYVAELSMDKIFTYEPGNMEIWIKVLHSPTQMVAKTNSVTHIIKVHKEVDSTIPEQELPVIDDLAMKVKEIDDYISELQEGDVMLVQPKNNNNMEE